MADYRNKGMEESEVSWDVNPYRTLKLLRGDYKRVGERLGHKRSPQRMSEESDSVWVCHSGGRGI